MTDFISMLLIDDNPLQSAGVVSLIRRESGFHVIITSADIEQALTEVRRSQPDLILLNLPQKGSDSLTMAGALHGTAPDCRVVVMGLKASHGDLSGFIRAGVCGFVLAESSFEEFLETIRCVVRGIQVLPAQLTRSLFAQIKRHGAPLREPVTLAAGRLTRREQEVASLITQGLSNKAIAARLQIALYTVKNHVHRVLSKLAINSRLELAAFSHSGKAPRPAAFPTGTEPALSA
ncbi:MAG: response regulator transcription factor [Gemmatimonadota bacterium]